MKKLSLIEITRESLTEEEMSKVYGGEMCLSASCACNYNYPDDTQAEMETGKDTEVVST